ncbi:MAG: M23 family metallopeptidase [Comamonadaceae bacterium]|nr:MAG: M23 family metallopeptidase [Comamonadaceae bacterium]
MHAGRHPRIESTEHLASRLRLTAVLVMLALVALVADITANTDRRMGAAPAPAAVATLRIEPGNGDYLAWADNRLAGPIEVILRAGAGNGVPSDPQLPARASVEALGSTLVARLRPASGRSGSLQLSLEGVPGTSNARPRDIEYLPPLQGHARIDQGFGGSFSHDDEQNRHALDFAADIGTPVFAARAGTVMQVEAGFRNSGRASGDARGRANFIRLLHDDGSMALYAHLAIDGVQVRVGQQVQAGQRIGLSGNTGFSTGPHLHFAVQVNRGMRLVSIPFRMRGAAQAR